VQSPRDPAARPPPAASAASCGASRPTRRRCPTGACYADGGRSLRAFYPDTAPGYFGDGWPGPPPRAESACGWQTPLVLHLGTFPWVYSSRLDGASGPGAVGLAGDAAGARGPPASRSASEPATNLRQDARQVAAIYRTSHAHRPAPRRLPVFQPGRAEAGRLYRRGGFLHVHQGSLHVAGLDGPRGRLAASAYNYILRRFAASSPSAARRSGPWPTLPPRSSARPRPRPTRACASTPRRWPVRAEP
jgi:hypothetical protein